MVDKYSLPIFERISLEHLLEDFTIAQLKDIASSLSLKIKSGIRKAVLVKALSETLLSHPEILIQGAFTFELKTWLDVITGNLTRKEAEDSGMLFALNRFGILYAFHDSEKVFIQPELANKLLPLLQPEIERRQAGKEILFEKMAIGCANIYGYVDMNLLNDYIERLCLKIGIKDEDELNAIINNGMRPVFNIMKINDEGLTSKHPFVTLFDPFMDFNIFEYIDYSQEIKMYDIETVLNFGEMPYPKFEEAYALPLKIEIAKHGVKDISEEYILRKQWLLHQNPNLPSIPNIDFLTFSDISQAQKGVAAIIEFQNNVPFWKLRGNSSAETSRKGMAKMRKEGSAGNKFSSANKVGRNDPCPCGSGKKYKHCCGR